MSGEAEARGHVGDHGADHDHDHHQEHGPDGHGHEGGAARFLGTAFWIAAVILLAEVVGGLLSHSLALLSDAGHMLTDVLSLGLAWYATRLAGRPPMRIPLMAITESGHADHRVRHNRSRAAQGWVR